MKKLLVAIIIALGFIVAYKAFAQVSASSDCSTASVVQFGNITITGSSQFYNSLLAQSQSDMFQKEQTVGAIQPQITEDQVQIATAQAGLNAIAACQANQVNSVNAVTNSN
jgi:hypothetical protein